MVGIALTSPKLSSVVVVVVVFLRWIGVDGLVVLGRGEPLRGQVGVAATAGMSKRRDGEEGGGIRGWVSRGK